MDEKMKSALEEYAQALKVGTKEAKAIIKKYKNEFPDFEKWAGALKLLTERFTNLKRNRRIMKRKENQN